MTTLPPDPPDYTEPLGYTLFSEDIRHEFDGKTSLIGVIPGRIALPRYPAVIAKLGVSIYYRQPQAFPRAVIDLSVIWEPEEGDRRLVVSSPVDMTEMTAAEGSWLLAGAQMVMSPFQVAEPGTLWVRAYRPDQPPMRMGGLRFIVGEARDRSVEPPISLPMAKAGGPLRVGLHKLP